MDDESKIVLVLTIVCSLCGYGVIIYFLYDKMLTFVGGFVVGLVILVLPLSYMASKVIMWAMQLDSW